MAPKKDDKKAQPKKGAAGSGGGKAKKKVRCARLAPRGAVVAVERAAGPCAAPRVLRRGRRAACVALGPSSRR